MILEPQIDGPQLDRPQFNRPQFNRPQRDCLQLVSLLLALAIVCQGQLLAQDGEFEKVDLPETVDFKPVETHPLATVLKEIRKAATLPGASVLAEPPAESLQIWVPEVHLGLDNVYNENSMRYFVARVSILNHSDEPVTLQTSEMLLNGWGKSYKLGTSSRDRNLMPIRTGRNSFSLKELKTPDEITIPQKSATFFWAVYTDLEKINIVEQLALELPLENGNVLQHDLRKEQAARLGVVTKRIGPADALGLLTIHGSLNPINAQDLAAELQELSQQKVQRVVITWQDGAVSTIDDLVDWLLHRAAQDLKNELYTQFPPFDSFKFLALANLPTENAEAGFEDRFEAFLYKTPEAAAIAGLEDLFATIDPKYLSREIRQGHPYSQRAALSALELRHDRVLSENLFPLLSQLYDTADDATRRYVLLAIGQQVHPQAMSMLTKIATKEKTKEAEAAFIALVKSNQPAAVKAILEMVEADALNVPRARQIEVFTSHFRRAWSSILLEALTDKSPAVRSIAMQGFVQVGHPNLEGILQTGLKDSSKDVRETAFAALVEREDRESEKVAVDYALKLLEAGEFNDNILAAINRTRDPRAAPLILKVLEEKPELREELLAVLEDIGNQRTVRKLLQNLAEFTPAEQILIYDLAISFDLPEQFELAQEALKSEAPEVRQMGMQMLTQQASDAAADEIASLLPESDDAQVVQICYALGRIGTKRAEELLKELRRQFYSENDESGLKAASIGLRLWMTHSPGWNAIDSAHYHTNIDSYESALVYFDLASEIDPLLSVAYSGKGNALLKLKRYDESLKAFKKAYEIDSFDGQAITGIGIVSAMQGETAEAVRLTVESAGKFPKDNIYSYNTACVYGRAIEYLRNEAPAENVELIKEYEQHAIQALKNSLEYGFDEFELMRTDPDIESLRNLPAFKELPKN